MARGVFRERVPVATNSISRPLLAYKSNRWPSASTIRLSRATAHGSQHRVVNQLHTVLGRIVPECDDFALAPYDSAGRVIAGWHENVQDVTLHANHVHADTPPDANDAVLDRQVHVGATGGTWHILRCGRVAHDNPGRQRNHGRSQEPTIGTVVAQNEFIAFLVDQPRDEIGRPRDTTRARREKMASTHRYSSGSLVGGREVGRRRFTGGTDNLDQERGLLVRIGQSSTGSPARDGDTGQLATVCSVTDGEKGKRTRTNKLPSYPAA